MRYSVHRYETGTAAGTAVYEPADGWTVGSRRPGWGGKSAGIVIDDPAMTPERLAELNREESAKRQRSLY